MNVSRHLKTRINCVSRLSISFSIALSSLHIPPGYIQRKGPHEASGNLRQDAEIACETGSRECYSVSSRTDSCTTSIIRSLFLAPYVAARPPIRLFFVCLDARNDMQVAARRRHRSSVRYRPYANAAVNACPQIRFTSASRRKCTTRINPPSLANQYCRC